MDMAAREGGPVDIKKAGVSECFGSHVNTLDTETLSNFLQCWMAASAVSNAKFTAIPMTSNFFVSYCHRQFQPCTSILRPAYLD